MPRKHAVAATAAAAATALVLAAVTLPVLAQSSGAAPVTDGPIQISELLAVPVRNASGAPPPAPRSWADVTAVVEWVELSNTGTAAADVSGWTVKEGGVDGASWRLPDNVALPTGGFLVLLCPDDDAPALPTVPSSSNVLVADGLRVRRAGLSLIQPDGAVVAATGQLPEQRPGVTFGLPRVNNASAGEGAGAQASSYTHLAAPTPWLINEVPLQGAGPFVLSVERQPEGHAQPGAAITVSAELAPNRAAVTGAQLTYRVNYGAEQTVPMTAAGSADNDGRVTYVVDIPPTAFKAGDMVRWAVTASDAAGGTTRDPLGAPADAPQYRGAAISVAEEANSVIPVLYWYSEDAAAAQTESGAAASLSFNGSFYDNAAASRRGVTALSWRKPKMNFRVPGGFRIAHSAPDVTELKLNSYFAELGDNSFMREVVAYKVMAEVGVLAPLSFHIAVYLNGAFYGLFGMIEEVDANLLRRGGLPPSGPLFKSLSGELSNLRWDLPLSEMPAYYAKSNRRSITSDWQLLANFTRGLAGGGPGTRTSFLYDNVDLSAVVNEAAVQTLLGNMDRCTKNFFIFHNPETQMWRRLPWDVEASMGMDHALGGTPGNLYCLLACEQWNSPLYCDSEHPQDVGNIQTPWGTVTAVGMNPYQGTALQSSGRRLLLQQQQQQQRHAVLQQAGAGAPAPAPSSATASAAPPLAAEGNHALTFPAPRGWDDPDRVEYGTASVVGAPGTYNHLSDALLDVASTRAMVMRRLRTLADQYYAGGRLREIIDATRALIKDVAAKDNPIWGRGDGSNGHAQLVQEFIPVRTKQLLQIYAPGGANPLLPGPQPQHSSLVFRMGTSDVASQHAQRYISLQLRTPTDQAVDVSGWRLQRSGGATFTLPPGTVFPASGTLHLAANLPGFRARPSSPRAGESVWALQVPAALLPDSEAAAAGWSLLDEAGAAVRLEGA